MAIVGLSVGLALSTVGLPQPAQALVTTGTGGWFWQNPLPQGNNLFGVSCPSTTTCFAVGDLGTIIATTNGGSSWVGDSSGTTANLSGISCPSSSTCYAVGDAGTIVFTSNGGATWASQNSGTTASLRAISCPGISACIAVGDAGLIIGTTGGAWSSQLSDVGDKLEGVSCPSTTTCFAVGEAGSLLNTVDGGATAWTLQTTATAALRAVACSSSTTCFAVGDAGIIAATFNGGTNWGSQTVGSADLHGVTCPGATACVAVGAAGMVLTTANGSSWFSQVSGTTGSLQSDSCPSASICRAVGALGTVLASANGGTNWSSQSTGFTGQLYGVSCPAVGTCFAVGVGGTILATTNGGFTWNTEASGTAQYLASISCPSPATCFAVGGAGTILATTSGGNTWSSETSGSSAGLLGVSCPSTTVCVAAGTGGTILATTNGGSAWSAQTSGTVNQLRGVSCATTSACFVVGASGTILATTNGGSSWSSQSSGTTNVLNGVVCMSASNCIAVGGASSPSAVGTIASTTNGGGTWSTQSAGSSPLDGVSCPSTASCFAVGDASSSGTGTILSSINGGIAWSSQGSGAQFSLRSVSCPGQCWAVGLGGTILSNPLPPSVTRLSSNSGTLAGGTTVTISGTHFSGATAVHFGAAAATPTVNSDTSITVTSPASTTPGPVDVTVTTPIATSSANAADVFTYGDTYTQVSTRQYSLANSDGNTWQDMDASGLSLTISPSVNSNAILTGNADLWTANAGFNQDIGINVNGTIVAWKESGGFAGTFSPNAAFVQAVVPMSAGTTYTVKLQWKANRAAPGATIYAGAGPMSSHFSPTGLSAQLVPTSSPAVSTAVSTKQYTLANSDGATWTDIDSSALTVSVTPSVNSVALVGGNADLWTANAGINQDIGINVNNSLVAWKESGGFAGTFSPNAAFVHTVVPMSAGTTYAVKLQWKANKPAAGATIYAGAGPIGGLYSPTRLTVQLVAVSGALSAPSTQQYHLAGSDGSTWTDIDSTNLSLTFTPSSNCLAVVGGNADLWTANAGYNQDIGISVNSNVVAWKESGGFGGTFSPNAAFVQVVIAVNGGTAYTAKLQWKANKSAAGATIYAGAGPISSQFSPTRLTVQFVSCS